MIEYKAMEGSKISIKLEKSGEEFKEIKKEIVSKFKNAKIDGFRKGHAPLDIVEKTFSNEINDELINKVLKDEYFNLLRENDIKPLTDLAITNLNVTEDTILIEAELTVLPEIKLGQYKGLDIKAEAVEVTDEMVKEELEKNAKTNDSYSEVEDKELAAEMGHSTNIDFEGFVDGVAFAGGKAEGHDIILGSKTFIDNFEDQIVGHKVGEEFEVNVNFPEAYHSEELKGKPALFKVKLNKISELKKQEINDEFAKKNGFDTVADFEVATKARLLENKENEAENKRINTIVTTISSSSEMDVPTALVVAEAEATINRTENEMKQYGIKLDDYLKMTGSNFEEFKKNTENKAKEDVKIQLIFGEIAKLENIEVEDKDMDAELERTAKMYGMDVEKLKEELTKGNMLDNFLKNLRSQVFVNKVVSFLKENN